jgi:hypothetical protein
MDCYKRHGEIECEIELVRVALFARRKLSKQIERAFKTSTCLGMNGLRDTAQPGAAPLVVCPRDGPAQVYSRLVFRVEPLDILF